MEGQGATPGSAGVGGKTLIRRQSSGISKNSTGAKPPGVKKSTMMEKVRAMG